MGRQLLSQSGQPLWAVDQRLRRLEERLDRLATTVGTLARAPVDHGVVVATHEAPTTSRTAIGGPGRARVVLALSWLIAGLAAPAAVVGLLWRGGTGSFAAAVLSYGDTLCLTVNADSRLNLRPFAAGASQAVEQLIIAQEPAVGRPS